VKTNTPAMRQRRFENTCVVVTRGRRLVRTWAAGLAYAHLLCRLDGAMELLDKPLPYLERDLSSLYESLFCQR